MSAPVAVHFSPHPDDELLGAPGALFALRDAGWRIVNVAMSLGRPDQRERRRAELEEACARARYELRIDDVEPGRVLADLQPSLVLAPNPHDRHPFHEEVARDVLHAVATAGAPTTVWLWSIWGESAFPSLAVELTGERLAEIEHALAAHEGELARTDFRRLLRGRAVASGVLGAERMSGFGALGLPFSDAELLTELHLVDERWLLGEPRVLNRADPLAGASGSLDLTEWLAEPSLTTRFGSRHI